MADELSRILFVEDEETIAIVAIMTLEDIGGFEVKHCTSGEEAVLALPDFKPQLVLTDMMMPGMDGIETFKKIRELPDGKDIPVIFMTAKAQKHEQEDYISIGAAGVVPKPFDPMTVCDTIRELWKNSKS